MLESMSNGVLTLDEEGLVATCNAAGARILRSTEEALAGVAAPDLFTGANANVMGMVQRVGETQQAELAMDVDLCITDLEHGTETGATVAVNVTVLPLVSADAKKLGTMIMLEDISGEKRVRTTMARYMDPDLADQLVRGDEDILGGKSIEATILFSDVRGFTTLAEELGPQGTVALLNDYFTIMVEAIQTQGGMLDKFIGDAIMAAFGLPVAHDDDPDRAVRASIAMISSLFEWNTLRTSEGRMPVDMGIGLNTDLVVAGNIGSPKRMDFTMIGDGVNLASRLESACKQYSARILVSEHTFHRLKGVYRFREVDHVIVKGKTEPVGVYEILDYHTDSTFPHLADAVNAFRDGIEKYRRGDWGDAALAFGQALKANPDDKLSQTYIERCEQLQADPPADWDGIWAMTTK
jgi:adenylate cyclase